MSFYKQVCLLIDCIFQRNIKEYFGTNGGRWKEDVWNICNNTACMMIHPDGQIRRCHCLKWWGKKQVPDEAQWWVWVCVCCVSDQRLPNLLCSFFFLPSLLFFIPHFHLLSHGYYGASPTHQVDSWTNPPWAFRGQDHCCGWQCVASQRRVCLCLGLGFETRHQKVNTTTTTSYHAKVTSLLITYMFPRYIEYFLRQIQLLKVNGVTPYIVFDGNPLPIKFVTVDERRRYIKISPILLQ